MSVPLPFSGDKVEHRQFHFFTRQKLPQVYTEQIRIDGIDMLKVNLSIRAGLNGIPVYIVIVQAHQNRLFAMDPELGSQTIRRGSFAGRTGACQHHSLGAPLTNHIRNLGIALFVERFVDADQFPDFSGIHQVIQVRNRFAFHQRAPAGTFIGNGPEMGHIHIGRNLIGILIVGIQEQEATLRRQ